MYIHKDWPRDLIHKATGARKEFKRPEDVPAGWFTVDGEEVNPSPIGVHKGPPPPLKPIGTHKGPPPEPEPLHEPTQETEASNAGEQTLRDVRGGGSDAQPRGKRRKRGHTEPDGSDAGVQDGADTGKLSDGE